MNSQKSLGFKELLALSLGTVIGAGVITLIGTALAATGRSVWVAYVLAVVVGFFYALPYIIASGVIRLRGGIYSLVGTVLGKKWTGVFIIAYFTKMMQYSLFGLGIGQYINSIAPVVPPKLMGILVIVGIFLLNLRKIEGVAMLQKIISVLLMGSLAMFIIVGLFNLQYNPFDFNAEGFFRNGSAGVMDALVILVFSTQGYYLIINYSGDAKEPRKHIPKVMLISAFILIFVYGGAGMVAGSILPYDQVAGQPLTYVAQHILPTPLMYLFIFGGACMALLSTLNGQFSSYGSVYTQGAIDGWYPKSLSKFNKHGKPVIIFTIGALVGILPILLNFNVGQITNNIMLLTPFTDLIPILAVCLLPKKFPEQWKNSTIRFSRPVFIGVMSICVVVQLVVAYWSARNMTVTAVIISLAVIALCIIYGLIRGKREDVTVPDFTKEFAE